MYNLVANYLIMGNVEIKTNFLKEKPVYMTPIAPVPCHNVRLLVHWGFLHESTKIQINADQRGLPKSRSKKTVYKGTTFMPKLLNLYCKHWELKWARQASDRSGIIASHSKTWLRSRYVSYLYAHNMQHRCRSRSQERCVDTKWTRKSRVI